MNKIKLGTFIRTVLQILAYVNQIVAVLGATSFANSCVYQLISLGITIVITALSYWYDNDWTSGAKLCSDIFNMVKDGKITEEELKEFMKKYGKKE